MKPHLMARLVQYRIRVAVAQVKELDDVLEISWVDKGTLIQEVSSEVLELDTSPLIKGRWRPLERNIERRTTWMVRDGWFQVPIIALWRLSLAVFYFWMGVRYAFAALRGRDHLLP